MLFHKAIFTAGLLASLAAAVPVMDFKRESLNVKQARHAKKDVWYNPRSEVDDYTILSRRDNYNTSMRVRTPELCDTDVKQRSGYFDTSEGKHFFFWQFDSASDPKKDPLIVWLNGGPGCSSLDGLLMENGPCHIKDNTTVVENKNGWNKKANIIFIEQPLGVGFSYTSGTPVNLTTTAAADFYEFMQLFLEAFDQFQDRDFYLTGESYAGRYIPVFAEHIVQKNKAGAGIHINLAGAAIGNGYVDPYYQYASSIPVVCETTGGYGPFLTENQCNKMRATLPLCQQLIQACYDTQSDDPETRDVYGCLGAYYYCEEAQNYPYYDTGRNSYDVLKTDDYIEDTWIPNYYNLNSTRKQLGVDSSVGVWEECSNAVAYAFEDAADHTIKTVPTVISLLDKAKIPLLFYNGDRDFICNWWGTNEWIKHMNWTGQAEFNKIDLKPWYAKKGGKASGKYKQYGNLTFTTVHGAGHFVPYNKPFESVTMLTKWIEHRKFW